MTLPDAQLNYWAERFIAAGVVAAMTFEAFIELPVPMRERRIQQTTALDALLLQERLERQLPDAGWRGNALIDPFHHGIRKRRNAWFRNDRNHV